MVLELLPNDFDQVELGTVRRQMDQKCAVVNEPAIEDVVRNVVMDACIVQNDQRRSFVALADDAVKEVDHAFAIDGAAMDFGVQLVRPEVQSAEYGTRTVLGGFRGMRFTTRRPRTLYRRRGAETGLVKVDQPDSTLRVCLTRKRQRVLPSEEFVFGALFLSEKRVRLNDSPRAINPLRRVPNEQGREA
jgi:hypothetical protein